MNAMVVSARFARVNTRKPRQTSANAPSVALPHWPEDTQALSAINIIETSAMLAGLNTCLPRTRTRNLLPIAIDAATAASAMTSVRSNNVSDSDVISGLRGSKRGRPARRVPSHCTDRAVAKIAIAFCQ